MRLVILDLETTINAEGDPSWKDQRNKIVAEGYLNPIEAGSHPGLWDSTKEIDSSGYRFGALTLAKDPTLYVGANLPFDLGYVKRENPNAWLDILKRHRVWDIQLAEYLLTGQTAKMASLDEMSTKYGGTLKDDKIKKMFEEKKIPKFEELKPYLEGDLRNTEKVFYRQYKRAEELGMLPLIWSQMDALLACVEATTNGLGTDEKAITDNLHECRCRIVDLYHHCFLINPDFTEAAINSPSQLGILFFGGDVKYKEQEQIGFYKNGKPKFKMEEKTFHKKGLFEDGPYMACAGKTDSGRWSVDEAVLKNIVQAKPSTTLSPPEIQGKRITEYLLDIRKFRKLESTYLVPLKDNLLKQVLNHNWSPVFSTSVPCPVFHRLNQTITATGRLSSSEPNLQNVADDKLVKTCFVPKIEKGIYVEVDWSQLEFVGLALYTQDRQLLIDLAEDVDTHTVLYESLYGRTPTAAERKPFKRLSFSLIYGSGIPGLCEVGNVSKAVASAFVKTFYDRYKEVALWHTNLIHLGALEAHQARPELTTKTATGKSIDGRPIYQYQGQSYLTNRILTYTETPSKYGVGVSPAVLKNYPIQSLATGDIVPMMMGKMIRRLAQHTVFSDRVKCQFVNQIHDSLLFEINSDYLEEFLNFLEEVLSKTAPTFAKTFNVPKNIYIPRFNLKVKTGKDWYNMVEVKEIKGELADGTSDRPD